MQDQGSDNQGAQQALKLQAAVLSHREFALLLTLLQEQAMAGEIEENEFAGLVHAMIAEDFYGDRWTFAPETGSWFNVKEDEWVEGEPRGPLLLALPEGCEDAIGELKNEIDRLEAAVRRETSEAPAAERATSPDVKYCTKCGNQLLPGRGFCTQCGTRQSQEAASQSAPTACAKCGNELRPGLKYCTKCGEPVPGVLDHG